MKLYVGNYTSYNSSFNLLNNDDWYVYNNPSYDSHDFEPDEFIFNFGNYTGSFLKTTMVNGKYVLQAELIL
jgi:hypothetical protein